MKWKKSNTISLCERKEKKILELILQFWRTPLCWESWVCFFWYRMCRGRGEGRRKKTKLKRKNKLSFLFLRVKKRKESGDLLYNSMFHFLVPALLPIFVAVPGNTNVEQWRIFADKGKRRWRRWSEGEREK